MDAKEELSPFPGHFFSMGVILKCARIKKLLKVSNSYRKLDISSLTLLQYVEMSKPCHVKKLYAYAYMESACMKYNRVNKGILL